MALAAPENLFPLPLTAFEKFMLADESSDYPMVFYMQVRLKGIVDRDIMRLAVDDALARHPLLCCRVTKIQRRLCWVWDGEQVPEADWDHEDWSKRAPWQSPIDLRNEVGLRVWGQQLEDCATLTLQFHHACCDGIGAARFLEDVAIAYSRHDLDSIGLDSSEHPTFRPIDLEALKNRGSQEGRRIANIRGSVFRRIRILCKYTVRYLRQQKVPLASRPSTAESDQEPGLGIRTTQLNRQQTRRLREYAKRQNSSLNDLLVKELVMMSHQWNTETQGKQRSKFHWKQPTFCVLVPTSLRGPADQELPACNVVSYVFMARPVSLTDSPTKLLHSIRDEMQLVRQYQAGWLFVQAIESMQRVPGLQRLVIRRTQNSCMSTTVLSHMGNLFNTIGGRLRKENGKIRMGRLQVEEIIGIPPIRNGTSAAFSTMLIDGCLNISMRCCSTQFSKSAAEELLKNFVACLTDKNKTASTDNLDVRT